MSQFLHVLALFQWPVQVEHPDRELKPVHGIQSKDYLITPSCNLPDDMDLNKPLIEVGGRPSERSVLVYSS